MILNAKNSLGGVHVAGKQTFDALLQQRFTKVHVTFDPRPDHVSNVTRQGHAVTLGQAGASPLSARRGGSATDRRGWIAQRLSVSAARHLDNPARCSAAASSRNV